MHALGRRKAASRQRVGGGRGVRRGGRGGRRGGRRRAQRRRQRRVHRRARRLARRRVRVAARVVERGVVCAAVEVRRVGRDGAARGRVVAGPVGGRHGRVHGAARRLRLRPVVRRRRVRVRPARLARSEVTFDVQLYWPPEPFARVLRHSQDAAFAESDFRREEIFPEFIRKQLD